MAKQPNKQIEVKPAAALSEEVSGNALAVPVAVGLDAPQQLFNEETKTLQAKQQEGVRKLKIEVDLLQAQLDKIKGDNKARKTHSLLIFLMVFFWLVNVIIILMLVGGGVFTLSEKVLITLLTTTSVNVIGLLVIVANYLFNKSKST